MLKTKFDFDASFARAEAILAHYGFFDRDDLQKAVVLREAAVVRMANSPFWSDAWHKASKDVAAQDEVLANAGIV